MHGLAMHTCLAMHTLQTYCCCGGGALSYQATAGGLQGKPPRLRSAAPNVCWTLVAGLLAAILSNKAAVPCSAGTISSMPAHQEGGHEGCSLALLLGWLHEAKLGVMFETSPRADSLPRLSCRYESLVAKDCPARNHKKP